MKTMNLSLAASIIIAGSIAMSGCGSSSSSSSSSSSVMSSSSSSSEASSSSQAARAAVILRTTEMDGTTAIKDANVSFPDANAVDKDGNPIAYLETNASGDVMFYQNDDKTPVNTQIFKDGYTKSGREASFTKNVEFVKMVNLDNPGEGVEVKEAVAATTDGALNEDLVLSAGGASLKLSAGTVLLDADGNKINGPVAVTAVKFDSGSDANALDAFPGGLSVTADVGGNQEPVNFVSAGFTSIEMVDENGNEVKTFSGGSMEIGMDVDLSATNPETGEKLKEGDIVPIWSYDTVAGKWKLEGNGEIKDGKVVFEATHLSYWNLDWFDYSMCGPATLNIHRVPENTNYAIKISGDGYSYTNVSRDDHNYIYNISARLPFTFTLLDADGNVKDKKENVKLEDSSCVLSLEYAPAASSSSAPASSSSSAPASSSSSAPASSSSSSSVTPPPASSSSSAPASSSSSVASSSSSAASSSSAPACATDITLTTVNFMGTGQTVSGGTATPDVSIPKTHTNQTLSFTMDQCIPATDLKVTLEISDGDSSRYIAATADKMSITCSGSSDATATLDQSSQIVFEGRDSNGDFVSGVTSAVDNLTTNLISANGLTVTWNFASLLDRLEANSNKFSPDLNVFKHEGDYKYKTVLSHTECTTDPSQYIDFDITNFQNGLTVTGLVPGNVDVSGEGFTGRILVTP